MKQQKNKNKENKTEKAYTTILFEKLSAYKQVI